MSTTHTISDHKFIPYTVVGGKKQTPAAGTGLAILLLNRGGRFYREELLTEICTLDFSEIIYIEGPGISYDIEPLSRKFPGVRFLLLNSDVSTGEKINLGFNESISNYLLVMWSDMQLTQTVISSHIMKKMEDTRALCMVPKLRNSRKEMIPTIQVPGFIKRKLKIIPWKAKKEGTRSVYPFDFCGFYNKEKFQSLGGFDTLINSPFWQKLDFGFRACLWGEKILYHPGICLDYRMDVATEDNTPGTSYKRFYLKNLAVKYQKGGGCLKFYKFFSYMFHSNTGPVQSLVDFFNIKKWVKDNNSRFKLDLKTIVNLWEPPET